MTLIMPMTDNLPSMLDICVRCKSQGLNKSERLVKEVMFAVSRK